MKLNPIKIENALFSCLNSGSEKTKQLSESKDLGELNCKIISVVNKTFKKIKSFDLKIKDVDRIKIDGTTITYYTNNPKHAEISYAIGRDLSEKISKFAEGSLIFERDTVGEKILAVSKNEEFANIYLYSSGGGGHKSAKEAEMERDFKELLGRVKTALEGEELHLDVDMNPEELEMKTSLIDDERLTNPVKLAEWCKEMGLVKDIDVLHDFLGNVGVWASSQWDRAQKEGDVKKQESLASKQWLSDIFFGPVIFISTLHSLINFKPKKIVSTQAMATPSILLAIKLYNTFFKPKKDLDVKFHLYMTDMPTEYAQHFFNSLRRVLSYGGKELLVLHAPKVEGGADWRKLCGLSQDQVEELTVRELPVRQDFLKAVDKYEPNVDHPSVEIKVGEQEEMGLLQEVMEHQSGQLSDLGDRHASGVQILNYPIGQKDQATFIMLGSQPTKTAIEGYVQEYLKLANENETVHYHVFTFAGKFEKDKDCFYKELVAYIKNQPSWPSNLHVVPLSYQSPQQLVGLEMMCDTITRSGGATAMELLVLNEVNTKFPNLPVRQRFIHAQPVDGRTLEDSIPLWEKGNYLFLKDQMDAKVIDPITFKDHQFKTGSE